MTIQGINPSGSSDNLPEKKEIKRGLSEQLASIFNSLDKDGDGKITEEEMKNNKSLFNIMQNLVGKNLLGNGKNITLKRLQKLGNTAKALIIKDFYMQDTNKETVARLSELARQADELANISTEELTAIKEAREANKDNQDILEKIYSEVKNSIHEDEEPKFGLD